MTNSTGRKSRPKRSVLKTPTGIRGLDELTEGGLPKARPTLLAGSAGSGKTLLSTEFIVKGILGYNENGAIVTFDESKEELCDNVASLGFDLEELEKENRIKIREIDLQSQHVVEIGNYNLEGLFAQLDHVLEAVNAKRLVIDGIENLFSHLSNQGVIRKELRRLFSWLKKRGITAIITCERGEGTAISRHGIEEYISDCVILLDQRIEEQVATRRLRVLKYRGSRHGTNEYPFLVTDDGVWVFPVTSMRLDHGAPKERVSSGIKKLDDMFAGEGYYRGSTILITGTAGTGKSSFAASFVNAVCRSGNKCIYFSFEESAGQIVRNMASIGLKLQPLLDQGLLCIHSVRPMLYGLEKHLLTMLNLIEQEDPFAMIIDPISGLETVGTLTDIKLMFLRILDILKKRGVTVLLADLTGGRDIPEATDVGISSVADTWILLRHTEHNGQRKRSLYIAKARGMAHSNEIHPFLITGDGIDIN